MRKKCNPVGILFCGGVLFLFSSAGLALDPVAPRAERKYGEIMVQTPLPTDVCEIVMTKDPNRETKEQYRQTFKPSETIKVPVGDYHVRVKLQETEWTTTTTIHPTERTDIVVTGYGNLKVNTPHPSSDRVEVYSLDGRLVKSFTPTGVKTLPTGIYNVKVKMSGAEITQPSVPIVTNTTREISASVQ